MPAGYSELFLEQGASFNTSITLDDVSGEAFNLVNYTATSQMRKSYYSSNAAATFSVSTGNDPSLGTITMSLTAANTANIYPGRYVYDTIISVNVNLCSRGQIEECKVSGVVADLDVDEIEFIDDYVKCPYDSCYCSSNIFSTKYKNINDKT